MRMNVTGSVAHVRGSGTEAIGICGRSGAIVELFCMYGTISACTLSLGTKLYGVAPKWWISREIGCAGKRADIVYR